VNQNMKPNKETETAFNEERRNKFQIGCEKERKRISDKMKDSILINQMAISLEKYEIPKQERAFKIYLLNKSGGNVGVLCNAYQISQSYFRQLRLIKKSEWDLKLIDYDEILYNSIIAEKERIEAMKTEEQKERYCNKIEEVILISDVFLSNVTEKDLKAIFEDVRQENI